MDSQATFRAFAVVVAALGASCSRSPSSSSFEAMGFSTPTGIGDAHPAHRAYQDRPLPEGAVAACTTCHGIHGYVLGIDQGIVLRSGTSTAGATLTQSSAGTSCTVACHYPFNAPVRALNWADHERCASCHATVNRPGAARRSSHDPIFSDSDPASGTVRAPATEPDATWCWSCHDRGTSLHLDGTARLVDAGRIEQVCVACHSGAGQTLRTAAGAGYVERTPPVFVGWTDAVSGDFHGARAGAGYGGTLKAPYARGQAPLPCLACHAGHASGNEFLLAATVNGTPIPPGSITRSGIGAEALCNACHEGERHAPCKDCHRAGFIDEGGVRYFDPASPAVDPEPPGRPCFWCHGHEGILHWTAPDAGDHSPTGSGVGCQHCHGSWEAAPEAVAPVLSPAPTASGVTATTATVRWSTSEPATTYVEYGVGTAGYVAGDDLLVGQHTVTLAGLRPSTTYVWRVRSSDQFRNVTESALQTFTTWSADAVPSPDLASVWAGTNVPNDTAVATLLWYPVTAPSGTTVQYEVQLASDPGFTFLVNAVLSRADDTLATGNSGWVAGTATQDGSYPPRAAVGFDVTLTNLPQDDCTELHPNVYYFRVRARDALGNVSEWSTTGTFGAMAGDPWC